MESASLGEKFIVRLDKGELIIETLIRFFREKNITAGNLTALGAISDIKLAHYNLATKEYSSKKIQAPLEIVNLSGVISFFEGSPHIHAHIIVSDSDMQPLAGHLVEATVAATCEVMVFPANTKIGRKFSEEIGLNLLDFS